MTFEQRMTELGVDLSDLTHGNPGLVNIIATEFLRRAEKTAQEKAIENNALLVITLMAAAIADRDDIIDRMETRIVNLTEELNYIKDAFRDCATCTAGSVPHSDKCDACDENFSNYEFAGVLEDRRHDDGQDIHTE